LKPRSLVWSRQIASPSGETFRHAAHIGSRRCAGVLLVAFACLALAGCQTYNPNLGASSTQSSFISLLTPSAKRAGDTDFTLTVNGSSFIIGSLVQWNGSNRSTTFVSDTQLTASITAADIATPGVSQVRVLAPGTNVGNNYSNVATFQVCSGACPQDTTATARTLVTTAGTTADSFAPAISTDRRYVAFAATSSDPSANASAGVSQVYIRDTCEGVASGCQPQTFLISQAWNGGQPNAASGSPSISGDGRYVAFASDATDVVENDGNGVTDVFVRDTCNGALQGCTPTTTRVSVGPAGVEANGPSASPSISADGRFVAFDSVAHNLVNDGSSAPSGAFVRDTCHGVPLNCTPSTARLAISPSTPR
jgi:hypothetical protein